MGALNSFGIVIPKDQVLVLWERERALTGLSDVWFPPVPSRLMAKACSFGLSDTCGAFSTPLQKLSSLDLENGNTGLDGDSF